MEKLIQLENAANVRDLGGYPTKDGKKVKTQRLVRGAAISSLSAKDESILKDYGVIQVIDFRSKEEEEAQPDQKIQDASMIFLPIFSGADSAVSAAPQDLFKQLQVGDDPDAMMKKVYRSFVESDFARKQYREFFELTLQNEAPKKSTLFHCTAGKDRTGFGAFILLSLMNVDQSLIMQDYLATNKFLQPKMTQQMEMMKAQVPPEMIGAIKSLMDAKEDYLTESITTIQEHYGDVDRFLSEGLEITKEERQLFNNLYTE